MEDMTEFPKNTPKDKHVQKVAANFIFYIIFFYLWQWFGHWLGSTNCLEDVQVLKFAQNRKWVRKLCKFLCVDGWGQLAVVTDWTPSLQSGLLSMVMYFFRFFWHIQEIPNFEPMNMPFFLAERELVPLIVAFLSVCHNQFIKRFWEQ